MRRNVLVLALLLMPLVTADAQAKRGPTYAPPPVPARARFLGPHPVAAREGGGYCYIETEHVHAYAPDHPALYQRVGDSVVFTGDPVPFGYDGQKTVYYGHHPIALPPDVGYAPPRTIYCSLRGPHYHDYPPPQVPGYKVENNVVFYVGPLDPEYARERPQLEAAYEAEYRPYVAQRPQVVVTPPTGWAGVVWAPPAVAVVPPPAPNVAVVAPPPPGVTVVAPPPPGVTVVAPPPPRVQIVAPPPPRVQIIAPAPPSVVIGVPPPPSVHIVAPRPPGVIIGAPPPAVIVAPGYHVHPGKHHGWGHGKGHHRD